MQKRKSKIILIYFFLLTILGSINNIGLSNIKFNNVENINISGLNNSDNEIVLKDLKNLNLESIFSLDDRAISKIMDSNTLIEKYIIFKKYPSTLDIEVKKTNFLANINKNGSTFIIGSNAKLIKKNQLRNDLPFIFGNPEINEFINLKKIIDTSNISYNEIKNFYFFKSKRWDLELADNTVIKLSENNIEASLNNAYKFLNNNNFENIKVIDTRIKNQVILND
tara:strand:+ start:617 stop:1288 length:672 start_codon:yes stop_codon:yes gene_type:complete